MPAAVFAMDSTEACTNFQLHGFRFLWHPALGARDHPGMILCFFASAVALFAAIHAAFLLGKLSLPPDRCSNRYPGNANDDLASLILHSSFPVFGKLLFCFGIVGNLLLHDCIRDFFLFVPSHFAIRRNGRLVPVDP